MKKSRNARILKADRKNAKTRKVIMQNGGVYGSNESNKIEEIKDDITGMISHLFKGDDTDRSALLMKEVSYKKQLNNSPHKFVTNKQLINSTIATFDVFEIYDILSKNDFFRKIWLPALANMEHKNTTKQATHKLPSYFTSNKVHPEFGEFQTQKPGQYYTKSPQFVMKHETLYAKSVADLWNWFNDKQTYLLSNNMQIEDFPLTYDNQEEGKKLPIIDIVTPTFINCVSKIINSYIKYGKKNKAALFKQHKAQIEALPDSIKNKGQLLIHLLKTDTNSIDMEKSYKNEISKLEIFLEALNNLFRIGPKYKDAAGPIYKDLFACIEAYCEFDYARMSEIKIHKLALQYYPFESIKKAYNALIGKIKAEKLFLIPMSTGLNEYKVIKSYTIPVIFSSIISTMGHESHLSSYHNVVHDISHVNLYLPNLHRASNFKNRASSFLKMLEFFNNYETLQQAAVLKSDELKDINHIVFGLFHESVINIYKYSYFPDNIDINDYVVDKNIAGNANMNYLVPIIEFVYFVILNEKKLRAFVEKNKGMSSKGRLLLHKDINIITDDGTKILSNPAHMRYIPVDTFFNTFRILINSFKDLSYYEESKVKLLEARLIADKANENNLPVTKHSKKNNNMRQMAMPMDPDDFMVQMMKPV